MSTREYYFIVPEKYSITSIIALVYVAYNNDEVFCCMLPSHMSCD